MSAPGADVSPTGRFIYGGRWLEHNLTVLGQQLAEINRKCDQLLAKETILMSQQDDINTDVANIETQVGNLNTAAQNIQAEIANLKASNPGVDTSALDAAVNDLTTAATAIGGIAPSANPTPAPSPAPDNPTPTS